MSDELQGQGGSPAFSTRPIDIIRSLSFGPIYGRWQWIACLWEPFVRTRYLVTHDRSQPQGKGRGRLCNGSAVHRRQSSAEETRDTSISFNITSSGRIVDVGVGRRTLSAVELKHERQRSIHRGIYCGRRLLSHRSPGKSAASGFSIVDYWSDFQQRRDARLSLSSKGSRRTNNTQPYLVGPASRSSAL